jgi:hypothetical protein
MTPDEATVKAQETLSAFAAFVIVYPHLSGAYEQCCERIAAALREAAFAARTQRTDELCGAYPGQIDVGRLVAERAALQAEVRGLREALTKIAGATFGSQWMAVLAAEALYPGRTFADAQVLARATALAEPARGEAMSVSREPQTLEEWKAAYFAVLKSNHSLQAEVRTLREALSYHSPGGAECREPVAACPMCAALATPRADVQG